MKVEISLIVTLGLLLYNVMFCIGLSLFTKLIKYQYNRKNRIFAVIISFVSVFLIWFKFYNMNIDTYVFAFILLVNTVTLLLIEISFIDFKYFEIPDTYNFSVTLIGVLLATLYHFKISEILGTTSYLLITIILAFATFVLYYLLALLPGSTFGGGDVKLSFGLGLTIATIMFFKIPELDMVSVIKIYLFYGLLKHALYSFLLGAVVSIVLLTLKIKSKKDTIAFGPYFALGFIILILISNLSIFKLI